MKIIEIIITEFLKSMDNVRQSLEGKEDKHESNQ
jgi:hypothetical protein